VIFQSNLLHTKQSSTLQLRLYSERKNCLA
jgi:hypothetical protein